MKITNIAIENLGPYVGTNLLDFSVKDAFRKVVLIGGKNGAGKTTLFNAIRIGLYGCKAYGFDSNNAKYLEIISQLINTSARLRKEGRASIQISVLMDDGKYDYTYTFERSWKLSTKVLKEELIILRNGCPMTEVEKSDFQSYLLQLIPPDMFRFYFFDGESISNFVFNGIKNTDFKNAFLKLCGLDTMDLIHENFTRISNMRKKDTSGAYQAYQDILKQQADNQSALEMARGDKETVTISLASIDDALAKGEQDFLHRGGISRKEYQAMQAQINKEESKREITRRWLKDTANDVLPFVVLRKQLLSLKEQIVREEQHQISLAFQEGLYAPHVREKLNTTFSSLGIEFSQDLADKVISVLSDTVDSSQEQLLSLSKRERYDLLAKINNLLAFDTGRVSTATKSIDSSLNRVKQIRKKMDKSDDSGAEVYFAEKERLLTLKQDAMHRLLDIERKIDALTTERTEIDVKVKKAQQKYEEFLKAKSVSDVTAKGLLAFADLQRRLYKKYIADVETSFAKCFSALINKSDLIDGIKIDDQLQVYPYKLKVFKRAELQKMIRQSGENYFISQLGSTAYDAYVTEQEDDSEEIVLPVEVKQQLSAGEKQIFIMALYQALSHLNKVSVPYIIDTPFARIDAEHRQNILNNFFMKLKGQIIILSTDEEIVDDYMTSISDTVSNFYLLHHTENSGTEILYNTYFGGVNSGI